MTGCELDVVATDKQTGAQILVEWKAYSDKTISADVLTKLMGNLTLYEEYKAGQVRDCHRAAALFCQALH